MGRPVFGLAVVRGDSMRPTLLPGDRLLVRYAASPRAGKLVIVRLPGRPIAVKRAVQRVSGGWDVRSDNLAAGTDSRTVGAIAANDVVAVVVCRVWPPGVRRRRGDRSLPEA